MKILRSQLRRLVKEEMDKLVSTEDRVKEVAQEDVGPDELADTLAKPIDMLKALKIEESKLQKALSENKFRQKKIIVKLSK